MAENNTPNYEINYEDERFKAVEAEEAAAVAENNKTYDGMIEGSDKYFNDQIAETERWGKEQADLQQEQTDFTIAGINQQKDWAEKDYKKEQSGAYADWQKQSNKYGANAEAMAAKGMSNSGYSESSQVQMYNTYQNRVATARESFTRAVTEYDNMITQARLSNNAALAQIAHDTLAKKLELSLAGFQYKNTLVLEEARSKREIEQMYHQRWQDVLTQMNTENSLAENVRQFGLNYALNEAQFEKYEDSQTAKGTVGGGGSGGSSGGLTIDGDRDTENAKTTIEEDKSNSVKDLKKKVSLGMVKTYNQAVKWMEKYGASSDAAGGLMTQTEWARRKKSGSNTAHTSYNSYAEYVRDYCEYAVSGG